MGFDALRPEMSGRSKRWLGGYAAGVALALGGLLLLLVGNQGGLTAGFLSTILPDSVLAVGAALVESLIDKNSGAVLAFAVTLCTGIVPMLCFYLKERASASLERDIDPYRGENPELPDPC